MLFAIALFALTACGKYEPPEPPNVEWNEHPIDTYVATLEISGLDEAYTVTATGQFMIKNRRECLPIDKRRSLGGSRHVYHETQEIPVTRVSEDSYKIVFYADAIKSSDYYGLGECVWHGSPDFQIRRILSKDVYVVANFYEGQRIEHICLSHSIDVKDIGGGGISRGCAVVQTDAVPD